MTALPFASARPKLFEQVYLVGQVDPAQRAAVAPGAVREGRGHLHQALGTELESLRLVRRLPGCRGHVPFCSPRGFTRLPSPSRRSILGYAAGPAGEVDRSGVKCPGLLGPGGFCGSRVHAPVLEPAINRVGAVLKFSLLPTRYMVNSKISIFALAKP